ncbi:spore germination protein [Fictibacillus iocasae]|uniref:Spore germination protein n=1 Tax=Fictibacillus iocasae TaxID=2715437 RepID=A0ABW2NSS4_9BACL
MDKQSVSQTLSIELNKNLAFLKSMFTQCEDVLFESYQFGQDYDQEAVVIYCSSVVQDEKQNLLKLALQDLVSERVSPGLPLTSHDVQHFFNQRGVTDRAVKTPHTLKDICDQIMNGHVIILFENWNHALSYNSFSVEKRAVAEPQNEMVVTGPREGTIENLTKNIGLIRARLKSPDLKFIFKNAGKRTRTRWTYAYLAGTVDHDMLKEFERRIEKIAAEEILETSYIAELIEDSTLTPFPQFRITERPDVAAAALLQGKIIVMVEGTGTIVICPGMFHEFFQSASDYYQRSIFSSLIRQLRIAGFILSITLPSIYIALTTFHAELIPTVLLIAILDTREGIPFPAFIEALIMIFFFELLQEAGIRLPKPIGSTVSIVGALIIGEASINAGIASPIMVVVIGLTGIASFSIPQYDFGFAARLIRLPFMLLAATLGGFGLFIGFILLFLHLSKLKVLNQSYLGALSLNNTVILRDGILRLTLKKLLKGPSKKNMFKTRS